MKLTAKRVAKLLKRPGRHPDGDNLYLRVSRPGKASWLLRYERAGRERMLGLGPIATISLGEARERAKAARRQLSMVSIRSTRSAPRGHSRPLSPPRR